MVGKAVEERAYGGEEEDGEDGDDDVEVEMLAALGEGLGRGGGEEEGDLPNEDQRKGDEEEELDEPEGRGECRGPGLFLAVYLAAVFDLFFGGLFGGSNLFCCTSLRGRVAFEGCAAGTSEEGGCFVGVFVVINGFFVAGLLVGRGGEEALHLILSPQVRREHLAYRLRSRPSEAS